ncbi:MAG: hypothetical protein RhofKO_08480 [Rhodothermales bacterium]
MVATHTTDVGNDHAAIRWYEFRRPTTGWAVRQQGTYAPDNDDRWMSSAAQDAEGNIFIGYTVSGTSTRPSIAYAAQTAGAELGTLDRSEVIFHASGGVQTSGLSRWGDYSQASVDPVHPNTFWYMHQYIPSTGSFNWATRVAGIALHDTFIRGRVVTRSGAGAEGIEVHLSGGRSDTAWTDADGQYGLGGLADGNYTVTPQASAVGLGFDPTERMVSITGSPAEEVDFTLTGSGVRLTTYRFFSGQVEAGEQVRLALTLQNLTDADVEGGYAVPDDDYDSYVHPYPAYGFTSRLYASAPWPSGSTLEFSNQLYFWIDGDAPIGHELAIPLALYDGNDTFLGRDTVRVPVEGTDTFAPLISISQSPGYIEVGTAGAVSAWIRDGSEIASAEAVLHLAADSSEVASVVLVDDGTGGDAVADDRIFTGQYVPDAPLDLLLAFRAADDKGNAGVSRDLYPVTSVPFEQTTNVLVVEQGVSSWYESSIGTNVSKPMRDALLDAGVSSDRWRAHLLGSPSIEVLSAYDAVLWMGGDGGVVGHKAEIEQYLSSGGRLAVFAQDVGSTLTSADQAFGEEVLRIDYVQHDVYLYGVQGKLDEWDGFTAGLKEISWHSDEIDATNGSEMFLAFDLSATTPEVGVEQGASTSPFDPETAHLLTLSANEREVYLNHVSESSAAHLRAGIKYAEGAKRLQEVDTSATPLGIVSSGGAAVRYVDGATGHRLIVSTVGPEILTDMAERNTFVSKLYSWLMAGPDGYALQLAITSGTNTTTLVMGTDSEATDGLDTDLDVLAPPPPPSGTFDARFIDVPDSADNFLIDIRDRAGTDHMWTLQYTAGTDGEPIAITWNPAILPADGSFWITDAITGSDFMLDMRTASSVASTDSPFLSGGLRVVYSHEMRMAMDLAADWNLVGLPLAVAEGNIEALIPNHIPGSLFSYNGSYETQTSMVPHQGYWLRMPSAETVNMRGEMIDAQELMVSQGWNIIAGLSCQASVTDETGVLVPGTLFEYANGYKAATTLRPGYGYWIRAGAAGSIGFTCSSAVPQAGKGGIVPPEKPAGFGVLAIVGQDLDQQLYFGGKLSPDLDARSFGLPPLSPDRRPDARFGLAEVVPEFTALVAERLITAQALAQSEQGVPLQLTHTKGTLQLIVRELPSTDSPLILHIQGGPGVQGEVELYAGLAIEVDAAARIRLIAKSATEVPATYVLERNYPNPFNPSTQIRYALAEPSRVQLVVYDVLGREVKRLVWNTAQAAGWHEISFNASELSSGVYVYRLEAWASESSSDRAFTATRRMMLIK